MDGAEYAGFDGLGLAELVSSGEVGAGELLAAAQKRADEVNPRVNAVVRRMDDEARRRLTGKLEGPFAGVPFLIKDLAQDYAGFPTSGGSRAFATRNATAHSTVVRRWLDAGLVVFGKTNTPEFGAKGVTESDLLGPARNPWDLGRTPGGSSGGAAAAVAAGIVPVAGASDGGGSIRIPAACCGLFGLKVGRGVVPSGPSHGEGFHGAAVEGVISRSVRDTAAMLDVIRGADPDAPYLGAVAAGSYLGEVGADPGRLRIGVQTSSSLNPTPHPEAVAAVDDAVKLLVEAGHEVEEAAVGYDDAELARDFLLPWFVRAATQVAEAQELYKGSDGVELDTKIMAAIGRATPAPEHEAALDRWHSYVRSLSAYHRRYDLLLTPTLSQPPITVGALDTPPLERIGARFALALHLGRLLPKLGVVEKSVNKNLAWVPYTQLANLTGRPAMSVPLYWTAGNLPLGVQFVAAPGGEGRLLRLAAQLELARPWKDRRPSL